ncbi:hypothetical protein ACFL27_04730 [candidate division CSSED10-310 bacterium]|uniref:Outer membrane protein beta-barrel domain-containing protein n=1 Tax=candidate division CSSED10-310 bacterium TaxID=2855610 RepID=A0ABV6YTI1_UNCC1
MKQILRLTVLCLLIFSSSTTAFALGLGFTIPVGSGSATAHYESGYDSQETDFTFIGFGFQMDLATAKDKLFNFHLEATYIKLENEDTSDIFDLDGIMINSDFGFGLVRSDRIRFWVGPEVRITYFPEDDSDTNQDYEDEGYLGLGIGPVIGLHIHAGSLITVVLKSQFVFAVFEGVNSTIDNIDEYDISFSAGILFRLHDDY